MGLLDHKRTWGFDVHASPKDCVSAFYKAFTGRPKGFVKADWRIQPNGTGATAVYNGRGVAGDLFSPARSLAEREGAIGSQVMFEVQPTGDGRTKCTMYLRRHGVFLGLLTSDARFIRPHMQAVRRHLHDLDASLSVAVG
jgi:hypothetical protein